MPSELQFDMGLKMIVSLLLLFDPLLGVGPTADGVGQLMLNVGPTVDSVGQLMLNVGLDNLYLRDFSIDAKRIQSRPKDKEPKATTKDINPENTYSLLLIA